MKDIRLIGLALIREYCKCNDCIKREFPNRPASVWINH